MLKLSSLLLAGALGGLVAPLLAQNGPPPEVRRAIDGVVAMLRSSGDEALDRFAAEQLAPSYRSSFSGDALRQHLGSLRDAARGHLDGVGVERGGDDALTLVLGGERGVKVRLMLDD